MKALRGDFNEIEAAINELHDYEVPEILATPVVVGNANYLDWIREETQDAR